MVSKRHLGNKQCSNLTLQHMLYEAPRLLQVIPKKALRAMFFTSKGLRQCLLNYVTSIKAPITGLQSLVDQEWPLLLQKLDTCISEDRADLDLGLHALAGAQWLKLAVLDLSNLKLRADAIQTLASAHLPSLTAVNLAGNVLLDEAVNELVKASWPLLEMLDLSCQLPYAAFDSTTAAYLVKGQWPLLKTLDVSGNSVCIGQLLNGNWPALEDLTLLHTWDDEGAPTSVKETSRLAWPSLKRLSVSDGAVDRLGIAELILAEWPCLESLCLSGLSAKKVARVFASCEWPALSRLEVRDIKHANKRVVICRRLSKLHLPVLETIVISECCFDAAAMAELAKAAWEVLRHVTVCCCPIRAAGVAQLVQANWCNLHVLDILCCALNYKAVSELSRGQWPLLHSLVICETRGFSLAYRKCEALA